MPLVVPLLRLAYVFLNVFETFKTLRPPPPSARNGGQPSARAMSQRKRAMKGCMTVWLVWVCFTLYERWLETFVWLFVPFYSEIKSLFILFFILTRAKGAEPIYLHVLRPLIKPYTVPLDALFDALASFGDLFVLVASIPIDFILGYYRRWTSAYDPPQADPQTWHRDAPGVNQRPSAHRAYASEANGDPRPAATRDGSTGSVKQTRSVIHQRSGTSTPIQQIWHPPASAYADEVALNPHSGLPTPPIERRQHMQAAVSPSGSDDWRQYPAFPSAYPATPLVAPKPIRAGNAAQFAEIVIAEEEEEEDRQTPQARQGFCKSLLLPREPRNPGSDGDLSDENQMKGVQSATEHTPDQIPTEDAESEMSMDEDTCVPTEGQEDDNEDDSDMDDDVFNTTFRTPYKRRQDREEDEDYEGYLDDLMMTPPPMKTTFSIDSTATRSTSLSTTDNGSSLRTRTTSITSTDLSAIDAPSLAGKKRRHPQRYAEDDVKFSVDVPASKAIAASQPTGTRSRSGTVGRRRGKALHENAESTTTDEAEDTPNEVPFDVKRQRVPGGRVSRPKPQRGDSQGTIRAPVIKAKSSVVSRPAVTVGRPPSARVAATRKERPVPLTVPKKAGPTAAAKTAATGVTAPCPVKRTASKAKEGN